MMINIEITKRQAEWLLRLLDGPSQADAKAATLYEAVARALQQQRNNEGQPPKEETP